MTRPLPAAHAPHPETGRIALGTRLLLSLAFCLPPRLILPAANDDEEVFRQAALLEELQ